MPRDAKGHCLNCGEQLRGQYCGNCGQRAQNRLISLFELLRDAFGDLFELDSRLWQTLIPLLARPGQLSRDYLAGRRARYMPPFRMYLVLSLLFFVIAFFDPREQLGLLFEAEPAATVQQVEPAGGDAAVATDNGGASADDTAGISAECEFTEDDRAGMPDWLARRLTTERMDQFCERVLEDDGRTLVRNLINNIPAALIVLLPVMALVLKALYPLSRRYYVEHLLFVVHFHAFFFLVLTLQILFMRLTGLLRLPDAVAAISAVGIAIYVPVYLFAAMRQVYGQGRLLTFLKFLLLTVAYLGGFIATMVAALAFAALSL